MSYILTLTPAFTLLLMFLLHFEKVLLPLRSFLKILLDFLLKVFQKGLLEVLLEIGL